MPRGQPQRSRSLPNPLGCSTLGNRTVGGGAPLEHVLGHITRSVYDLKYLRDIYICLDEFYDKCHWVGRQPIVDLITKVLFCPNCDGAVETILERHAHLCDLIERAQDFMKNVQD